MVVGFFFVGIVHVPELQEHHGIAPDGCPFQHDGGIFPMPKPHFFVDVFICQIRTAIERNVSINDQNFAVVTVVLGGRKQRTKRVEASALNVVLLGNFQEIAC